MLSGEVCDNSIADDKKNENPTSDAEVAVESQDESEKNGLKNDSNHETSEMQLIKRSIYVGNVDYGSTPVELEKHFASCGKIRRITIMSDRITGKPKGYAYIEFIEPESAQKATELHGSIFRDREIKVMLKRANIFGFNSTRGRGPFVFGFRGRGKPRFRNQPF